MDISLPKTISPNGEELWDWAGKLSQHIHLTDQQRTLQRKLFKLSRECGSCRFWMTRDCPQEVSSMTGYNKGPSMSAPICSRFVMSQGSLKIQRGWLIELTSVNERLKQ